jgi:hypothetical protein
MSRPSPTGAERTGPSREAMSSRWSEDGDTLIEVLLAIVVLGIASVALILSLGTTIFASGVHRNLVTMDTVLKTATDATISQMTQSSTVFGTCSGAGQVSFAGLLPSGYTAQITQVWYWNWSSFTPTCTPNTATSTSVTANSPRLVTVTVTFNGTSVSMSTVVDNPLAPSALTLGPATHLAFLAQPGNEISGSTFNPQPVVAIEDSSNNIVTTNLSPVNVVITSGSGTGGAPLSGCTATEYYGVVNFSNCTIVTAGSGYTLTASDAGLASATSTPFNVTPGPSAQLVFTVQPGNASGGAAFGVQPVVTVEDAGGNAVSTDASSINLAISSGTGANGAAFGCTLDPANAVNGIASFAGCKINLAGTGYTLTATDPGLTSATSNPLTVVVGPASKLMLLSSPGNELSGTAFGIPPVVAIQDAGGNTVTASTASVTMSITGGTGGVGATLTCASNPLNASSGVATFSCSINKVGTGYTLTASSSGLPSATTNPFNISAGSPSQFVITSTPLSGTASASATLGPLTVQEQDALGNPTTTAETVTLGSNSVGTAKFSATSSGSAITTVSIPSGSSSATFYYGDTKAGSPTITVSGALTSGTQVETISAGSPSQLVTTSTPPASSTAGTNFTVALSVEDSLGNVVTSSSAPVALAIGTNPGTGTLTCASNPLNASSGVATFSCSINKVGTGYTLTASSSGLPSATTNPFNISAGSPSQFVITSTPLSGTASASATLGPLTVQEQDALGNPTTTAETVTLGSNSVGTAKFSATSSGSAITTVSIPSGSSSATFYYGDTKAGSPTITVSGALTSGTQVETISAGSAAGLSFTNASIDSGTSVTVTCTGTVGSSSFSCTLSSNSPNGNGESMTASVLLIDQFQNPVVNTSGATITVSLNASDGSVSPTSVSITNGSSTSSSTFNESLNSYNGAGIATATATLSSVPVQAKVTDR